MIGRADYFVPDYIVVFVVIYNDWVLHQHAFDLVLVILVFIALAFVVLLLVVLFIVILVLAILALVVVALGFSVHLSLLHGMYGTAGRTQCTNLKSAHKALVPNQIFMRFYIAILHHN